LLVTCGFVTDFSILSAVSPMALAVPLLASGVGLLAMRLRSTAKELARQGAEASYLAHHDMLTTLPNRHKLEAELFAQAQRGTKSGERLSAAVINLDRFKDFNDTLGHHAGDSILQGVACRLRSCLPETDFVARLGSDEFAVLRHCAALSDADSLSLQIMAAFAESFDVNGHVFDLSASVGVATATSNRAMEDLIRDADIAMHEAKIRNRGGVIRFAPAMAAQIESRRALEADLRHAISKGELVLHYQPIIDAETGLISSVEALSRWTSPKHGNVPPDIFVPLAENCGLMADIGRYVIDQAVQDSRRWPGITTAINISVVQLKSASVLQDLLEPTRIHGVSPTNITLEITESILMTNDPRTLRTLDILKEHGFGLSLDDFGTGYASLAYIRDFPFDKLKIDRSYVAAVDGNARGAEMIRAIVGFGRILGREIIAEGVETEAELAVMKDVGVSHLQGFLFSRPMAAAHIEALVAASESLSDLRPTGARPVLRRVS
jgi:diguanylate cyclase (GGDEF)-like protein